MADQHKTLIEYSSRMDEYDKKNEETNRKFSTLLQVSVNFFSHVCTKYRYFKNIFLILMVFQTTVNTF